MFVNPPTSRSIKYVDLVINSRFRNNPLVSNSNDFFITLDTPLAGRITKYGLQTAMIPRVGDNIFGSFTILSSGGNEVIPFVSGNYNAVDLRLLLQTTLNANSVDTYVVTLVGTRFVIVSSFAGFALNPLLDEPVNGILVKLGYTSNNVFTSAAGTLTSPSIINLSYPEYLYIRILPIAPHIKNVNTGISSFAVNYNCAQNGIVYHNSASTYMQEFPPLNTINALNLQTFGVRLQYENGELYNLDNADWSFTISLELLSPFSVQN